MKTYTFKIEGTHCAACEIIIEREVKKLPGISRIEYLNGGEQVVVNYDHTIIEDINNQIKNVLEKNGYKIDEGVVGIRNNRKEWFDAVMITISVISIYVILQNVLKTDFTVPGEINYVSIFIIGIIASVSTCMAVVGGIVLSLSSQFAKNGKFTPIISFHISRLVSFFILGGVIGAIGSVLRPTLAFQGTLEIILFIVFIVLGLNLLGFNVFRFGLAKKIGTKSIGLLSKTTSSTIGNLSAIAAGVVTFILPCGFTQAAQFSAIGSGSFLSGGLIMLVFSLGTLPVLAIISFVSVRFIQPTFYKASGLIIISFAFINILQNWEKIRVGLGF